MLEVESEAASVVPGAAAVSVKITESVPARAGPTVVVKPPDVVLAVVVAAEEVVIWAFRAAEVVVAIDVELGVEVIVTLSSQSSSAPLESSAVPSSQSSSSAEVSVLPSSSQSSSPEAVAVAFFPSIPPSTPASWKRDKASAGVSHNKTGLFSLRAGTA